jgi:ATP-dependent Clp protease adaptor protein ClpS
MENKENNSVAVKEQPVKSPPKQLPLWKVLLHNDDKNSFDFVINSIVELTTIKKQDAEIKAKEAHDSGLSLLLVTHKERAELYQEQFQSKGLSVTIEPDEK